MKKRLISMLLTLVMLVSMVAGMSVGAYADDTTGIVEYTLKNGDYVLRICQQMGINYYTCKSAIMKLNGLTNEAQFSKLAVGRTIKLPVSDAVGASIAASGTTTGTVAGTTVTTGTTATGGVVSAVKAGDSVAYYLIPYTLQPGETVAGVCNALGISFATYAEAIQKINNIGSWNKVAAGKTLLLPTNKAPLAGTTCYQVVAHKIASGETAYNMSSAYGVDYGKNTKLLQALNNTDNLGAVKAGATFYVPVATTITLAPAAGGTGTGTGTATGTGTGTSSGTATPAKKLYTITSQINTAYGTMSFYVNNQAVNSAAAGDVVTVNAVTTSKKAIDGLTVRYADGSASVKLEGSSFIMPACNVRVDAVINEGYDITIESNMPTITAVTISGVAVTSATQGSNVRIISTNPAYSIKNAQVFSTNRFGIKKLVTLNDENAFIMPVSAVTVKVELEEVKTYDFYRGDVINGNYDIQVDGFSAQKAAKGTKVTIVARPMTGYHLTSIGVWKYKKTDGIDPELTAVKVAENAINVLNNSFIMPGCDVYVELGFGETNNSIIINAVEGGILRTYSDPACAPKDRITEANTGVPVYIQGEDMADGYQDVFRPVVTRNADGNKVNVTETSSGSKIFMFVMPAGGVTIDGSFVGDDSKDIAVKIETVNAKGELITDYQNNGNRLNYEYVDSKTGAIRKDSLLDGAERKIANVPVGSKITLSTEARDNCAFTKYQVLVEANLDVEATELANTQGYFIMPKGAVTLEVIFTADTKPIMAKVVGSGTVSFMVSHDGGTKFETANSGLPGETAKMIPKSLREGFAVSIAQLQIVDLTEGKPVSFRYEKEGDPYSPILFEIPKNGAGLYVVFGAESAQFTLQVADAANPNALLPVAALQGKGFVEITINGTQTFIDNDTNATTLPMNAGDLIKLSIPEPWNSKYFIDSILLSTSTGKYAGGVEFVSNDYSFDMTPDDLDCVVYLRAIESNIYPLSASYDGTKGTVGFRTPVSSAYPEGKLISEAKAGDEVFVSAKALPDYKVAQDSLDVRRLTDGGYFTIGTAPTPPEPLSANEYIPVKDTEGNTLGWRFIMPEGGVAIQVRFIAVKDLTLSFKISGDADATQLTDGTFQIDVGGVGRLIGTGGTIEKMTRDTSVNIGLTTAGRSQWTIENITVTGASVIPYGLETYNFNMPDANATVDITLKKLPTKPTAYNIVTETNNSTWGSVSYSVTHSGETFVQTTAQAGDKVSATVVANDGFIIKKLVIINDFDKTEITPTSTSGDEYAKDCEFTMPANDARVKVEFEVKPITATLKVVDGDGATFAGNNLLISIDGAAHVVCADGNTLKLFTGRDVVVQVNPSAFDPSEAHLYYVSEIALLKGTNVVAKTPAGQPSIKIPTGQKIDTVKVTIAKNG